MPVLVRRTTKSVVTSKVCRKNRTLAEFMMEPIYGGYMWNLIEWIDKASTEEALAELFVPESECRL